MSASHFTRNFPVGATVFDGSNNKRFKVTETGPVYIEQGTGGTLEDFDRAAGQAGWSLKWWLIATNLIVVIVVFLVYFYRRR